MVIEEVGYRSFLLRLWWVKQNGEHAWRASLEDPRTKQKHFFPTLETLCEFLLNIEEVSVDEMDGKENRSVLL